MSKIDAIKEKKRQQNIVSPTQALAAEIVSEEETIEENNIPSNQEINQSRKEEKKVERKRVSFDLRTDLHKELKLQALMQDKNIYHLIEEALEKYLKEGK